MGYVFVVGECYVCHRPFSFHPNKVPSVRDANNIRQPICQDCIDRANDIRKTKGLPPHQYSPDAYQAADENDVDWDG